MLPNVSGYPEHAVGPSIRTQSLGKDTFNRILTSHHRGLTASQVPCPSLASILRCDLVFFLKYQTLRCKHTPNAMNFQR